MKKIVYTPLAPEAVGPYSQALILGNLVFTSGQLPLDPMTMKFPEGGIREQSRQSLTNLKRILEESGASLESVLKTTCFLADMNDFLIFNDVYGEFFGQDQPPARSCVEVGRLPKDALVEIEAIAYCGS